MKFPGFWRRNLTEMIEALSRILWTFHSDHLQRMATGLFGRLVEDTVDATVKTISDNLAPQPLASDPGEFVPPKVNLRYIWQSGEYGLVVIEDPPGCRTVRFSQQFTELYGGNRSWHDERSGEFYLSFPYVIYVVTRTPGSNDEWRLFVHYRTRPWTRTDNGLLICNLPNVYEDGDACLGQYTSPHTTLLAAAADLCGQFVQGLHSRELEGNFNTVSQMQPWLGRLDRWELVSRANPGHILTDYPLIYSEMTVAKHLAGLQLAAAETALTQFDDRCHRHLQQLPTRQLIATAATRLKTSLTAPPALTSDIATALTRILEGKES